MFATTEAMVLFPTYIWVHLLKPEERDRVNHSIRTKLTALRANDAHHQGGQTEQNLHQLPEFHELNRFILAGTQGILNFLEVAEESIEITSCWANINPQGATQPWHTHPNNYISGVYYVDLPIGSANIRFQDPRAQSFVVSPRVKKNTPENSGRADLPVKEGMLLLFPSWLAHAVTANPTPHDRISISFNLMFSSFTEKVSPVKWQGSIPTS